MKMYYVEEMMKIMFLKFKKKTVILKKLLHMKPRKMIPRKMTD